jgi:hypothetical protein
MKYYITGRVVLLPTHATYFILTGTPEELALNPDSMTGAYLKRVVGGGSPIAVTD